ncbi:hypothetical protein NE237_022812 [Protea cynaroides]|uniref:Uncharacterized protein n=1 Tax=Protea cynaroides TaxID=273540 RepID=A0A9Q0HDR7_9MAGN|nr:hypothetical protein NE237_022812 [Protea cynaroides]
MYDLGGLWMNEKHWNFLNSMEATFVHTMLENGSAMYANALHPPLDRYLPDDLTSSAMDLDKQSNGAFVDPERKVENAEESATTTTKLGKGRVSKEIGNSTLNSVNKSTAQIKKPSRRKSSPLNWIESKEADDLLLKAEKNVAEAFEVATAMGVVMYDRQDCPQKQCEIDASSVNRGGSTTHTVTASFETPFEVDREVAAAVKTAFVLLAHCPSSLNKDEFKDLLRKISQNPDINESNQEVPDLSLECESDTGSELESESHKDTLSPQGLNCKIPDTLRERKNKNQQLPQNINTVTLVDMMFDRLKCLDEDELASLATIVATCGLNAALMEVENSKQHAPEYGADYTLGPITSTRNLSSYIADRHNMEYFMDGQMRRKQLGTELPSLDKFLVKHMSKLEREVQEAKNTKTAELKEAIENKPVGSEDRLDGLIGNVTSSEAVPDLGTILVKNSSKLEKEIEEAKHKSRKTSEEEYKGLVSKQDGLIYQKKKDVPDVPSLDKLLVKHMSKLEREVQEAKNTKTAELKEAIENKPVGSEDRLDDLIGNVTSSEAVPDLGTILVKNSSKLEKEIEEAKHKSRKASEEEYKGLVSKQDGLIYQKKKDVPDVPSLDKLLVKHISKLEREVQEARKTRTNNLMEGREVGKENIDSNKGVDGKLTMTNSTEYSQIERANTETAEASLFEDENGAKETGGLHGILVKRVHGLEKEKMQALTSGINYQNQKKQGKTNVADCESLDKVLVKQVSRLEREKMGLVKHQSRLEKEKLAATQQSEGDQTQEEVLKARRRNINIKKSEGGLEQILVKHQSRLEKDKLAAAQQSGGHQTKEEVVKERRRHPNIEKSESGLEHVLVKHQSRLEKEKLAAAQQSGGDQTRGLESLRDTRERELKEAWGGLSLGNSMRPYLSRLERDKAAWIKAEEEQKQARVEQ